MDLHVHCLRLERLACRSCSRALLAFGLAMVGMCHWVSDFEVYESGQRI